MSRYLFLRRLRGPVLLVTFGLTALLDQWHVLSFGHSWPLYLILFGLLRLLENLALTTAPQPPTGPVFPGSWSATATPQGAGFQPVDPAPNATFQPGERG